MNHRLELQSCPICRKSMEKGFCHRANGLSFVAAEKMSRFLSIDEDLAHAGFRKFLPSRAEYYRSYLCRDCNYYAVDFGISLSTSKAKEAAAAMIDSSSN